MLSSFANTKLSPSSPHTTRENSSVNVFLLLFSLFAYTFFWQYRPLLGPKHATTLSNAVPCAGHHCTLIPFLAPLHRVWGENITFFSSSLREEKSFKEFGTSSLHSQLARTFPNEMPFLRLSTISSSLRCPAAKHFPLHRSALHKGGKTMNFGLSRCSSTTCATLF